MPIKNILSYLIQLFPIRLRKRIAVSLLSGTDLTVKPSRDLVCDVRRITNVPLRALTISYPERFIIDVNIEVCRNMGELGIPVLHQLNPITHTAIELLQLSDLHYENSFLKDFYTQYIPGSVADVLDLEPVPGSPDLLSNGINPLASFTPWSESNPVSEIPYKMKKMAEQSREYGIKSSDMSGYKWWGPVSYDLAILEFKRIADLVKSIRENGYIRNNGPGGDIGGVILQHGNDYRVIATGGQHRISVCAAFGFTIIPIRASSIVQRSDVNIWPGVVNGYFTKKQALQYFDRVFQGLLPKAIERAGLGLYQRVAEQ